MGYGMGTGTFGGGMQGAAAGNLLTAQGTRIYNPKNWVDPTPLPEVVDARGGSVAGIGSRGGMIADASTQFDDGTVTAAEGIFGNTNARQAAVGGSGMMVLEKHLSPVNNNEEEPLYSEADWHKVASVNDKYAVNVGTAYNTRSLKEKALKKFGYSDKEIRGDLTAYKPPNPPYDPKSGDDGAGGTEYDINK